MHIERYFLNDASRYQFDTLECPTHTGWAQIDTADDASYYDHWANPTKLTIVSYVEGDVTITKCDTKAEFVTEIRSMHQFYSDNATWRGIDCMCSPDIELRFLQLDLAHLLH